MIKLKIIRIRILTAAIICILVWLAYQYMNSVIPPTSLKKDIRPDSNVLPILNPEKILRHTDKVSITVFYECLCPDSRSFFLNHLLPSYEKAPDLITIDLVPYGKATTTLTSIGHHVFECQHGTIECYGNKVHACTLVKVKDVATQLKFIGCMIDDNYNPNSIGSECASKHNVQWDAIFACANSVEGDILMKQHGDKTAALTPKVSFIPTVLINNNRDDQAALLKNLWKEICRHFIQKGVVVPVCQ